jgi:hypothetical protein
MAGIAAETDRSRVFIEVCIKSFEESVLFVLCSCTSCILYAPRHHNRCERIIFSSNLLNSRSFLKQKIEKIKRIPFVFGLYSFLPQERSLHNRSHRQAIFIVFVCIIPC